MTHSDSCNAYSGKVNAAEKMQRMGSSDKNNRPGIFKAQFVDMDFIENTNANDPIETWL
jgi:hypothetical protein